jgi:hypothetical protein
MQVTFTINLDPNTAAQDNGFLRPLRFKPGTAAPGTYGFSLVLQPGPWDVIGMSRFLAFLTLVRFYLIEGVIVTYDPYSATQTGMMHALEGSPQDARLIRDLLAILSAPGVESWGAGECHVLRVTRTNYQPVNPLDQYAFKTSPFSGDTAAYVAHLGSDREAFLSLAIACVGVQPLVPQDGMYQSGFLKVTFTVCGFDLNVDARVHQLITPADYFAQVPAGGRRGNEVIHSAYRSYTAGADEPDSGGMRIASRVPFRDLGAKAATASLRGFEFTKVGVCFGVLGAHIIDAIPCADTTPSPDNVVAPYIKWCAADSRDPDWVTPIPAADYSLVSADLIGSDGKVLATNGFIIRPVPTWEELTLTAVGSEHGRGAPGGLAPQGLRKTGRWGINGHCFFQLPTADPSGTEMTWAGGVSPYIGPLAKDGGVVSGNEAGAYPRYVTTVAFRDLTPGLTRVGGFLESVGQILGTVGTVVNAVVPIAGAVVKVLAGGSNTPGARRKPRAPAADDSVPTFSSAFTPQGDRDALTVGYPAGFNQKVPAMWSSRWSPDQKAPSVFDTIYKTGGVVGSRSCLNSLSVSARFSAKLMVAEQDIGWVGGDVFVSSERQPGTKTIELVVPMTGARLAGKLVVEIQFLHAPGSFPGPHALFSPLNTIGEIKSEENCEAEIVNTVGTDALIRDRDGTSYPVGAYAVIDLSTTIGADLCKPPPEGYYDAKGEYHLYDADEPIAIGAVFDWHFILGPTYNFPAVAGVSATDKLFFRPADLFVGLTCPQHLNFTGQFGTVRCRNPGSATSEQYAEVIVERTAQLDGTVTGTPDPNWATVTVSEFSIGAGALDRTQSAVPTE